MQPRHAAALAVLLFTACESAAPTGVSPQFAASPNATTQTKTPLSGVLTSPCTGEAIQYEGFAIFTQKVVTEGDVTTTRVKAHTTNVQGVGLTTGRKYKLNERVSQEVVFTNAPPFPQTIEQVLKDVWTSQGNADNFVNTQHVRQTFDGTTTTTEVLQQETECRG